MVNDSGVCGVLRLCRNAKGCLLFLSLVGFILSLSGGLMRATVSTIEKRFKLRSSEMGIITISFDIAACIAIPVVAYLGAHSHKPVWIGLGIILNAIGSLIFCLPHFIAPTYSIRGIEKYQCDGNAHTKNCVDPVRVYRFVFIASQLLQGLSAVPINILTVTYLDENVSQVKSSLYNGILFAVSSLGPGTGFLIAGQLLATFTNMNEKVDISRTSALWVGNWWLGVLIMTAACLFICIPIFMFPRKLPGTENLRLDREKEMHVTEDTLAAMDGSDFGTSARCRDLPQSLRLAFKNPTLMLISFAGALDDGLLYGIGTFGPKYIQTMYNISSSKAAMHFGLLMLGGGSVAHLLSGYLITRFELSVKAMMRVCIACSVIALACYFVFAQSCKNASFFTEFEEHSLHKSCHKLSCGCAVDVFNPVCGSDNKTYLSQCQAGCLHQEGAIYSNCSRVGSDMNGTVTPGACHKKTCSGIFLFLLLVSIALFSTVLKGQPVLQVTLRSVPFSQRSFSLGIQSLISRVFGTIPWAIIFGRIIDLSCVTWGTECGKCGSCLAYNDTTMSRSMTILISSLKISNIALLLIATKVYNPVTSEEELALVGGNNTVRDN